MTVPTSPRGAAISRSKLLAIRLECQVFEVEDTEDGSGASIGLDFRFRPRRHRPLQQLTFHTASAHNGFPDVFVG